MSYTPKNFITTIDNAVDSSFCEEAIEYFSLVKKLNLTYSRQALESVNKTSKNDEAVFMFEDNILSLSSTPTVLENFCSYFWLHYQNYSAQYDVLNECGSYSIQSAKLQKTNIGEGYHRWHFENDNSSRARRIITFILYLNDVEEGGETEFLYYPLRVKPKAGTLVIFPAGYTHTHRGNPPISNEKYILTGWLEYNQF